MHVSLVPVLVVLGLCTGPWYCSSALAQDQSIETRVKRNVEALKDEKSVVMRAGAAKALGNIGRDASDCTPALAEALLKDKHPMVRAQAAKALGKINNGDKAGARALSEALWYDKSTDVRKN
ncbi:MAG: HEAT repeat domain-containing protein, partial [Candidatus Brocadiales bacterium]|nr:HEAT repeat domain-containing protein [Candidatus Bathyanammoxibius sp.]